MADKTAEALAAYRASDPNFQRAIEQFAKAEAENPDPVEGSAGIYGTLTAEQREVEVSAVYDQPHFLFADSDLGGPTTRVAAYDWAMQPATKEPNRPLQNGDLVKIFRTISNGHVCWSGTADLHHTNYQRGVKREVWDDMIGRHLPTRLERKNGEVIFGSLDTWGDWGPQWLTVRDYSRTGYEAAVTVDNGDRLTIYDTVMDGEVEWQGRLSFRDGLAKVGEREVVRQTDHLPTEQWLTLSFQNRPVILAVH